MKLRIFVLFTCIILILSVTLAACNKQENVIDDSDTDTSTVSESESDTENDTESDTEPEFGDSNQAQGDRENEETTREYLDYYKEVADDKLMHVTFGK